MAFTRVFMFTKKAPNSPQTIPRINAPGMTSVGVIIRVLILPYFNVLEVQF